MKFKQLYNTINSLIASTSLKIDKQSADTISEVKNFMNDFKSTTTEMYDDTCILMTESDVIDMLNMITYNEYAKLYNKLNRKPLFKEFMAYTSYYKLMLPSITDTVWKDAYDVIADLFAENMVNPCDPSSKFIINCDQLIKMINHQ